MYAMAVPTSPSAQTITKPAPVHLHGGYRVCSYIYLFSDILDIGASVAGEPQSGRTFLHDQKIATVWAE